MSLRGACLHQQGLILILTAVLLLAGCAAPGGSEAPDPGEAVVERPDDYEYLESPNGSRPHIHDYWNGAREIDVFDDTVELGDHGFGGSQELELDGAVIPGTRWINITSTWDAALADGPTQVYLSHRDAFDRAGYQTIELPRDGMVSLETNDTRNDPPHAVSTRWQFSLSVNGVEQVDVDLRITIVRAPGPLEPAPAHPDHWNGSDELLVADWSGSIHDGFGVPTVEPFAWFSHEPWRSIIPPGTRQVTANLALNVSSPEALAYDPRVSWRSADTAATTWNQRYAPPTDVEDPVRTWVIDVESAMWDSPYVEDSWWTIVFHLGKTQEGPVPQPYYMQGDYHVWIVAEKDPAWRSGAGG